jgi:hypothetical protein
VISSLDLFVCALVRKILTRRRKAPGAEHGESEGRGGVVVGRQEIRRGRGERGATPLVLTDLAPLSLAPLRDP